jgi:hypothetical protein
MTLRTSEEPLFDLIAERQLDGFIEGLSTSISVRIGRPFLDPRGDWSCPIQIIGIGDERIKSAGGVDAIQAMQLAMQLAGADLKYYAQSTPISWLGETHLGFPACSMESTGSCPYCPRNG